MDYTIKIGGAAGQGIQTIGSSLSKVFSRYGYHLFSHQDYESRVRGGHNFFQIRFSEHPVLCPRDPVDILIALDKESIPLHGGELSDIGFAVYDSADTKEKHEGPSYIDVPFSQLAVDQGGNKVMANTAATGAVLGMLGMDVDLLAKVLEDTLKRKDLLEQNIKVARAVPSSPPRRCSPGRPSRATPPSPLPLSPQGAGSTPATL
jgi:2-oxoglutarate ferredoxin oxidoreductase subunit alpha